ncbi:recombination factor protein RarA [Alcanivorax sp. HI0083]|uniref:replication-associated recombination protein A n=1 Tax=unclassified Alcanivorax TaxID=2638842 RepID=UPI0007B836B7|nr:MULTISPECIES: replication-associated recombination protein A [unclassified Alcanivorax]KZY32895.1 recombination factor protein RarA [Alcanivorax sp. HI0044]KZZ28271.1 recombination factor protein RarA [Alcanivorax sp. HI0083]PHR68028.1 MAG: replication-associated recombination protein A [Alcanivorax sp.]
MSDLFAADAAQQAQPLAARLRPAHLDDYVGQQHLVGEGKPLRQALDRGQLHSMILWGPPGTGKTTLALIMAQTVDAAFITLSAVLSGVKDIRAAVEQAQIRLGQGRRTVLFVDEVHRFNKAQQDAFLPHVEEGTITFIGATTENPSFELNNALLSRARVYRLRALAPDDLSGLLGRALQDPALNGMQLDADARELLLNYADGDARRLLNMLEVAADLADQDAPKIDAELMREVLRDAVRRFDKGGDLFYDQISAMHKSVRGSDPDAALYWFARMLDGGCDPLYLARRVVRMASEDIGNADPRALTLCLQAWDVQERLGSPEGELAIAQAIAYLAVAPKSNAVYNAYNQARALVRQQPTDEVPLHLRNAPTQLMKDEGFGAEYHYAHDFPEAFVAGENYFPASLQHTRLYEPVNRGLEIKVAEKLARLRGLNASSDWTRYGKGK